MPWTDAMMVIDHILYKISKYRKGTIATPELFDILFAQPLTLQITKSPAKR